MPRSSSESGRVSSKIGYARPEELRVQQVVRLDLVVRVAADLLRLLERGRRVGEVARAVEERRVVELHHRVARMVARQHLEGGNVLGRQERRTAGACVVGTPG